ncbi:MAG: twin-arginine translocation signal domain-containing protein, partial [Burkholderiales bacterium]
MIGLRYRRREGSARKGRKYQVPNGSSAKPPAVTGTGSIRLDSVRGRSAMRLRFDATRRHFLKLASTTGAAAAGGAWLGGSTLWG